MFLLSIVVAVVLNAHIANLQMLRKSVSLAVPYLRVYLVLVVRRLVNSGTVITVVVIFNGIRRNRRVVIRKARDLIGLLLMFFIQFLMVYMTEHSTYHFHQF